MKNQNQELAALICKYEEMNDKNLISDMAIKLSEMCGLGDPILIQRALKIIEDEVRR